MRVPNPRKPTRVVEKPPGRVHQPKRGGRQNTLLKRGSHEIQALSLSSLLFRRHRNRDERKHKFNRGQGASNSRDIYAEQPTASKKRRTRGDTIRKQAAQRKVQERRTTNNNEDTDDKNEKNSSGERKQKAGRGFVPPTPGLFTTRE